jgi:hypothetical protein
MQYTRCANVAIASKWVREVEQRRQDVHRIRRAMAAVDVGRSEDEEELDSLPEDDDNAEKES